MLSKNLRTAGAHPVDGCGSLIQPFASTCLRGRPEISQPAQRDHVSG
jgi:hypothetical protein